MAENNTRYIDIDTDTRVGYNYIKQQFYVTNKEYTTYRNTVALIREVLNALDIPTDNPSDEDIQNLQVDMEDLHSIYYTLQDNGAYIHTLQFNDFKEYPLTIDCEKAKLYIMNTSVVYDLTLNESPRNVRIPRILSFYKDTCGLLIDEMDMRYFYSLLLSYYKPTCYNQISYDKETKKYFYNNKFLLSNFDGTSNAVYNCTYNPNNTAPNIVVGYVVGTDTTNNTFIMSEPLNETLLKGYNKVILKGTDTYLGGETYSADGDYTIASVEDNVVRVKETVPFAYSFPYKECYVLAANYTVSEMRRDTREIVLTEAPTDVLVGDVIIISGAAVTSDYETISCNGTYTVNMVGTVNPDGTTNPNVIVVDEEIPTDFTGSASLIKEVFISNISKIRAKKLTLTDSTDLDLTGATVLVHTLGEENTTIDSYTVSSYTSTSITVNEDIPPYNFISTCPKLYIPIPDGEAEVLINVTSVSENAEEVFPVGEFMVDNFDQCVAYIGTLAKLVKPTEVNKDNMYRELPTSMELEEIYDLTTVKASDKISCSINIMDCKGIYSTVYTE